MVCHLVSLNCNHLFYFKVFDGNNDQFTVVSHNLQNPIITRYIRINPVSYHTGVALRVDFYGCKSGKYLCSFPFPDLLAIDNNGNL